VHGATLTAAGRDGAVVRGLAHPSGARLNVGLGDLFVMRMAEEVVDKSILATLEYGGEHLHIALSQLHDGDIW
jgi:hypothetical protein